MSESPRCCSSESTDCAFSATAFVPPVMRPARSGTAPRRRSSASDAESLAAHAPMTSQAATRRFGGADGAESKPTTDWSAPRVRISAAMADEPRQSSARATHAASAVAACEPLPASTPSSRGSKASRAPASRARLRASVPTSSFVQRWARHEAAECAARLSAPRERSCVSEGMP